MFSKRASENAAVLLAEIHLETEIAWNRKAALENRAFAVFTLNLAVATLYLAIRSQLNVGEIKPFTSAFWVLAVTFVLLIASTVGAVVVIVPRRYPKLSVPEMTKLAEGVSRSTLRYDEIFARSRLGLLKTAHTVNQGKAKLMVGVLATAGAALIGFAAVILLNQINW